MPYKTKPGSSTSSPPLIHGPRNRPAAAYGCAEARPASTSFRTASSTSESLPPSVLVAGQLPRRRDAIDKVCGGGCSSASAASSVFVIDARSGDQGRGRGGCGKCVSAADGNSNASCNGDTCGDTRGKSGRDAAQVRTPAAATQPRELLCVHGQLRLQHGGVQLATAAAVLKPPSSPRATPLSKGPGLTPCRTPTSTCTTTAAGRVASRQVSCFDAFSLKLLGILSTQADDVVVSSARCIVYMLYVVSVICVHERLAGGSASARPIAICWTFR